jgi:crotonobetainyl-CoA:carnitine CoA-transferase CaiB-like acyl-CoA transferase
MEEPAEPGTLPLQGLRVVTVESYGAGPYGSMVLADLGAEVIKVENRAEGGDSTRRSGPHFDAQGRSYFYETFNRNKRSLTLDLGHPEGQAVLHDLTRSADAVMNNLRGDVPARLGLDYAALGRIAPRIVCVHLSAYGRQGSRAAWPGYDFLMQAETGYLHLTGEPDGPPARCGVSVVDMMGGLSAGLALLAGVLAARASGRGRDLDVSLFDTALSSLWYVSSWYLNTGHTQSRLPRSAHASLGPTQLCRTRDGWIFLMCPIQKFWVALTRLIGRPDLTDHPQLRTLADRHANRALMTEMLDEALSHRTTAEWMQVLGGHVPAAPVLDVAQALENPFVQERRRVAEYGPAGDTVRLVKGPIEMHGAEAPSGRSPALGADTDAILLDLGYDPVRLRALREKGVI